MDLIIIPQMTESVHRLEPATREGILQYLRKAPLVWAARMRAPDEINPTADPTSVTTFTDGLFVWSNHFASYVERYDMRVPEELLTQAASAGFEPPTLPADTLNMVRRALRERRGN